MLQPAPARCINHPNCSLIGAARGWTGACCELSGNAAVGALTCSLPAAEQKTGESTGCGVADIK